MRMFFLSLLLGGILVFPASLASAQSDITLPLVSVQLWPEYDQPSMLVITDFEIPAETSLPVNLTFRIPKDANLIAVAIYTAEGELDDNVIFDGPKVNNEWQVFTITMTTHAARFEYYDALAFNGNQRTYTYAWNGRYAVDQFHIRVLEPLDTISLTTDPALLSISKEDDLKYFSGDIGKLALGEKFSLDLAYEKTSKALVFESQGIQPADPVDENTPGRVSLNNSLPYVIGGLGLIMLLGGSIYLWQSGRSPAVKPRQRSSKGEAGSVVSESYCPQCGARAQAGDRFCRTCGARLRYQEE
jgi:hypothetical protein